MALKFVMFRAAEAVVAVPRFEKSQPILRGH